MIEVFGAALAEIAASCDPLPERAGALLGALQSVVPFDAAWLALVDPLRGSYGSLASTGVDAHVVDFLSGPLVAHGIELTGTDRDHPPLSPSDLPYAAEDLRTWSDCLVPAGIHEALAVALFTPAGRHVGFLALLSGSRRPPSGTARRRLAALAPVLAQGLDPMRSITTLARMVHGTTAGTVLRRDGGAEPLPGLDGDPLLAVGSPLLTAACERIADGQVCSSFLWPRGGRHAPDGHARVTVFPAPDDLPAVLAGVVLLSPAPDLHGLTPRELEVLGLMVDGCTNEEVARTLVVAPRTVAAHVEHLLVKLDAPTRTLAAVRAERKGLYVPAVSQSARGGAGPGDHDGGRHPPAAPTGRRAMVIR